MNYTHLVLIDQQNYGEEFSSIYVGLFDSQSAAEDYVMGHEELTANPDVRIIELNGAIDG